MSFSNLSGLSKNKTSKKVSGTSFWSALSNLQNDSYAANMAGSRLQNTIKRDVAIREAVAVLKQARANFRAYGATEAAMAIFNQGSQLSQSLGIAIPKVTSVNAAAVGKTCCSKINGKISETVKYAKHYGSTVVAQTASLINKTNALAETQRKVLELLYNKISNDIKVINAKQFGKTKICGYTRPIFMERVDALQTIVDNLHRTNTLPQCKKLFSKQFALLGWNITEDGEIESLPPEEIAEQAPAEQEVMNPVVDPETGEPITEDADEDEVPPLVTEPEQETEEEVPSNVPQEQPMAIFGWNPSTIKQAASSLHKLTNYIGKFAKAYSNMLAAKRKISTSVESYGSAMEKTPVLNTIDSCRKYNTFVGNLIVKYNAATDELISQTVAMYGVLKDAEVFPSSKNAVNVKSITAKTPWGMKNSGKGFFNTSELPEGDAEGEEDESGTEVSGDLTEGTEGPTKATPPEEGSQAATDRYHNKNKSTGNKNIFTYDEDLPEGDANGEEDDSGVAKAGDLEDDIEGPTKATPPEEELSNMWASLSNNFTNLEDEGGAEDESAAEGDAENEKEEDVEEAEADAEDDAKNDEEDTDSETDDTDTDTSEKTDDEKTEEDEDIDTSSSEGFSFFDDDELPEGDAAGTEDDSDTPVAGELENETEGPTTSEDPAEDGMDDENTELPDSEDKGEVDDPANEEATTTDFFNNMDLPEGDANGETDGSDTELPGDLPNETEGPTKATSPVDFSFLNLEDDETNDDSEDSEAGDATEKSDDEGENSETDGTDGDEPAEEEEAGGSDENEESDESDEETGETTEKDEETNPMKDYKFFNEDEEVFVEEETNPDVSESEIPEESTEIPLEETDGDAPADPEELKDGLDTVPTNPEYTATPEEDESSVNEDDMSDIWKDEDADIEGPNTPSEFPTEPAETPDGVDNPNGDVDIPDAQTEPYMQPESTPPEEVAKTTINKRKNYFE